MLYDIDVTLFISSITNLLRHECKRNEESKIDVDIKVEE